MLSDAGNWKPPRIRLDLRRRTPRTQFKIHTSETSRHQEPRLQCRLLRGNRTRFRKAIPTMRVHEVELAIRSTLTEKAGFGPLANLVRLYQLEYHQCPLQSHKRPSGAARSLARPTKMGKQTNWWIPTRTKMNLTKKSCRLLRLPSRMDHKHTYFQSAFSMYEVILFRISTTSH